MRGVASVASFFLSRIDALVDPMLEEIAKAGGERAELARELHGEIAVASAKGAYAIYQEVFAADRFRRLEAGGRARRSACCGPAPAPRTRTTGT